jgi:hypothetical protein
MFDDFEEFVFMWLFVIGGFTLFLLTLRLMVWIFNGIAMGGWF